MMLFGYTAAIIGFTGITAPGDIFDLVVLRVEESTLGIICATVIHGVWFPRLLGHAIRSRFESWLTSTDRWAFDLLNSGDPVVCSRDRIRLAAVATVIHQLAPNGPSTPRTCAKRQPSCIPCTIASCSSSRCSPAAPTGSPSCAGNVRNSTASAVRPFPGLSPGSKAAPNLPPPMPCAMNWLPASRHNLVTTGTHPTVCVCSPGCRGLSSARPMRVPCNCPIARSARVAARILASTNQPCPAPDPRRRCRSGASGCRALPRQVPAGP